MPTYIDCINRVQDDFLNRTTFNAQVRRAINTTIRQRQRERFWFNETQTALTTTISSEFLDHPVDMLILDRLEIIRDGDQIPLLNKPLDLVRAINANSATGYPSVYAEYANKWYLANIPDSAYPVNCFYIMKMDPLSADTDTNKWLSAAEDVVVYGAAKLVWSTTVRNVSAASVCAQLETDALYELRRMRDQRADIRLTPTRF